MKYIEKKIHICTMGVDLKERLHPKNEISRDDYRIIFVGRLVEKKGVTHLLGAIKILTNKYKKVNLILIGDGPERSFLENECKNLKLEKHVKFYGSMSQDKLPELYLSASIFAMPSIIDSKNDQEGLGLVAVEAMGCGCAVVASSLGAINDIIEDGINGIMVKPGDKNALADAISSLLSNKDKKSQIALNGRNSVIEKFDWDVIVAKYAGIIRSLD